MVSIDVYKRQGVHNTYLFVGPRHLEHIYFLYSLGRVRVSICCNETISKRIDFQSSLLRSQLKKMGHEVQACNVEYRDYLLKIYPAIGLVFIH